MVVQYHMAKVEDGLDHCLEPWENATKLMDLVIYLEGQGIHIQCLVSTNVGQVVILPSHP
jgi:hypothetical protein